jgi:hypothetical protein
VRGTGGGVHLWLHGLMARRICPMLWPRLLLVNIASGSFPAFYGDLEMVQLERSILFGSVQTAGTINPFLTIPLHNSGSSVFGDSRAQQTNLTMAIRMPLSPSL